MSSPQTAVGVLRHRWKFLPTHPLCFAVVVTESDSDAAHCYELQKGITVCVPSGLFRDYVEVLEDTEMVYRCKLTVFFPVLGEPDEAINDRHLFIA